MNMLWGRLVALFLFFILYTVGGFAQASALVFQTDFGLRDGAVSAMKGVAFSVSPELSQFDLTHEIPPFDIWQGSYRLRQVIEYWPAGTVFVSVVDPGVGSARKSIVAKTRSGHFIVTPDNGTLTLIAKEIGIDSVRLIDEKRHRLPGSSDSYTFHGRDVYAFTGAKLAAGIISFYEVGSLLQDSVVMLPFQEAVLEKNRLKGMIPVLDLQYGNIWTNIPQQLVKAAGITYGDLLKIDLFENGRLAYSGNILFGPSFSSVKEGEPVAYLNSLLNLSIGINMGNMAERYKIGSGTTWSVVVEVIR